LRIKVLLFAQARERAGQSVIELDVPPGSRVSDALAALEREHPGLTELRSHLAIALDQQLAPRDAPLMEGAELALLPPVSGGSTA
jgi:molybdopterin synthase catalytic subunit